MTPCRLVQCPFFAYTAFPVYNTKTRPESSDILLGTETKVITAGQESTRRKQPWEKRDEDRSSGLILKNAEDGRKSGMRWWRAWGAISWLFPPPSAEPSAAPVNLRQGGSSADSPLQMRPPQAPVQGPGGAPLFPFPIFCANSRSLGGIRGFGSPFMTFLLSRNFGGNEKKHTR